MIRQGQIIKIHSDFYYVENNKDILECKLREVLKKQQKKPCVGDIVTVDNGYITTILPRKSFIKRPAVANIDQIVIVTAIEEPHLNLNQLDRYIAFAEYSNIDIKLCFNKNDLTTDDNLIDKIFSIYEPMGYDIVFTSALEHLGLEDFREIMKGKISVLCGSSGVGKSSLLNALNPNFHLRTNSISNKSQRGTHTTRHSEILTVTDDTKVIDTPGFSNLKFDFLLPWEVAKLFRDMQQYIGQCKFQNCIHLEESDCAIKNNLDKIYISRYESYKEFVKEAKEYKEKITFEGKKKETFEKRNNNKISVKISSNKRQLSRKNLKQNIYKEGLKDE